jgi:hypothetical protein
MAEERPKEVKTKKPETKEITFRCQRCKKLRPLSEMRSVTRFIPVLIVCQDCAKELR